MNPNYCHTVTVFCCLSGDDNEQERDIWYSYVLNGCSYRAKTVELQNGTEASSANTYTLRIPTECTVQYRPYAEWCRMAEEDRKRFFTVSPECIVVHGKCTDKAAGVELLRKYKPDAFEVTSFSDNTACAVGKHYRLGGGT